MSVAKPKPGTASPAGVLPFFGLLAVAMVVANSGWGVAEGRSALPAPPFPSVAPLRAGTPVGPVNRSRLFAWPSHGTSTYQRAARMARHGDPEARMFVGGESDVNPFDAR
jgi:hypothetical protein